MSDLKSYLPPILHDIKEINAVFTGETPEIESLKDVIQEFKDNQFIGSLDDYGAKRWETPLKIIIPQDESIEDRRFRILAKNNQNIPYTKTATKESLASLSGNDFTYEFDKTTKTLKVRITAISKGNFQEIFNMLEKITPADVLIDLWYKYDILTKCGDMTCGEYHIAGTIGKIITAIASLSNTTAKSSYELKNCGTFPLPGTVGLTINNPIGVSIVRTSGVADYDACGTLTATGMVGLIINSNMALSMARTTAVANYNLCGDLVCGL